MREFDSGATRDNTEGKYDFDGFLSPLVLDRYGEYMNKHRTQADGKLRDSDNWQKGIPLAAYMKSAYRHFFDWWANHRKVDSVVKEDIEESLCALLFNTMGYLHEYLKSKADEYNAAEIDGPRFKMDSVVIIRLRKDAGNDTRQPVNAAYGKGIYKELAGEGHLVTFAGTGYWFYDDEVFPMEDI